MRTAIHRIGRSILVLLAFGCAAAQADLTATVDRNAISEFDLVTLSLRLANDPGNVTPDFSVVEKDFTIVSQSGPSRQSQFIFSNGQQMSESHTEWDITLRPKRKGTLTIPPIRVGNQQTQPIEIDVSAASASMTRRMNQYVFFDTSVDTHEAYVQGQIIYTVKLFYVDSISGDFPAPPNLSGAVVETIESEKRYESIVNNRRFYVLEKRYAIYPQQSGELVIPGERFNGARGRGSFFSAQEPVSAGSPAIKIDVKPRPASFTGEHWLPAKSVQLTESIKQDGSTLKVGEPFNRTLRITAEGLASSLLPPFAHLDLPNAKTYQDPPETNDSPMNGGVKSSLSTTIGIVPTEPGTLTLPAIEVPWWNTQTNKMEVARLPPHTFTVEPGNGATVSVPETPTAEKSSRTPLASDKGMPAPNLWMYVAIGFAVLWLITLWLWFSLRQQIAGGKFAAPEPEVSPRALSEATARTQLKEACDAGDAARAHAALHLWARAHYPELRALADLPRLTGNLEIAHEISELERVLFAPDATGTWNGAELARLIASIRDEKPAKRNPHALTETLNPPT